MKLIHAATALLALGLATGSAGASSLRVSPVGIDLKAGTAASTVRIWNNDRQPVNVQVRVFRWTKVNGKDRLEPTADVVASPPMTKLGAGSENLIRVVRVTKRAIEGKESYRLMVDELPDPRKQKPGTVNVVVRHSIPVHFSQ
jgi:fimbrial chaperone protein